MKLSPNIKKQLSLCVLGKFELCKFIQKIFLDIDNVRGNVLAVIAVTVRKT